MNFKNWPYQLKFGIIGLIIGIILGIIISLLFFYGGPYNIGPKTEMSNAQGLKIFIEEPRLAIEIIVSVSVMLGIICLFIGVLAGYVYKKIKNRVNIV